MLMYYGNALRTAGAARGKEGAASGSASGTGTAQRYRQLCRCRGEGGMTTPTPSRDPRTATASPHAGPCTAPRAKTTSVQNVPAPQYPSEEAPEQIVLV